MPHFLAIIENQNLNIKSVHKFTDKYLHNIILHDRKVEFENSGLGIRRNKKIVFLFTYMWDKKQVWRTLGKYPALSLKQARIKHNEELSLIESRVDPRQHEKKQQNEDLTIEWLCDDFYERDLKINRKRPDQPKGLIDVHIKPRFGNYKLLDITRRDIKTGLDKMVDKGIASTANKTLSLIKQMLDYGISAGVLESNVASPIKSRNVGGIEKSRERNLSFEEIKILLLFLDSDNHRISKEIIIAIKLLILTGSRTSEVREAEWSEFDFKELIWTIPAARYKTGIEHKIPITPTVKELLDKTPKMKDDKKHLFNLDSKAIGRSVRRSLQPMKNGTIRLDLPHFTIHDIRRSVASRMSDLKVDAVTIEKILGHKLPKILQSYNRGEMMEEQKAALEAWSDKINTLIDNSVQQEE